MKMNAYIAGVGMTRFGKHMDISLKGWPARPSARRWRMRTSTAQRWKWLTWAMPPAAWSRARK